MTGGTERGSRRLAREAALASLFSEEFGQGEWPASLAGQLELPRDPPEYAQDLIQGVRSHLEELDERISTVSLHWRMERMSIIDRNIIRIGAYEILFVEEVERAVAINEAVEIARRYGDTDSWSFVNGVLDAVAKSAEAP